ELRRATAGAVGAIARDLDAARAAEELIDSEDARLLGSRLEDERDRSFAHLGVQIPDGRSSSRRKLDELDLDQDLDVEVRIAGIIGRGRRRGDDHRVRERIVLGENARESPKLALRNGAAAARRRGEPHAVPHGRGGGHGSRRLGCLADTNGNGPHRSLYGTSRRRGGENQNKQEDPQEPIRGERSSRHGTPRNSEPRESVSQAAGLLFALAKRPAERRGEKDTERKIGRARTSPVGWSS